MRRPGEEPRKKRRHHRTSSVPVINHTAADKTGNHQYNPEDEVGIVANGLVYDGIVASVLLENTYFTQSLIDSTRHQHRTRAAVDAFRDCDYPACETICGRPSVPVLAFAKSGCHPLKGIRFVAALCLPNDWPAGQKSK